ncbi:VPLPA-CTERM sorting domain-containing protein [Rhodobacteraceae bacterium NNCM2]|nr:VPLPA-CTERM sorting domain-containing protein [Coraliihabitans acroporae]
MGAAAVAASLSALPAAAATYNVNLSIGAGSVTGTIETDGTLGVLATGNITDWELALFDGVDNFTLFGDGSANDNSQFVVVGSNLTATVNEIVFDFTPGTGLALFQAPTTGSGQTFFCIEGGLCGAGAQSLTVLAGTTFSNAVSSPQTGTVTIGTVSAVPLPTGAALLLTGLAGFAVLRRRKETAA